MTMKGFSQTFLTNWTCCWTGATILEIKGFQQHFLIKKSGERSQNSISPRLSDVELLALSLWDQKDKKAFKCKGKLRLTEKKIVTNEFN
jgi:hypothetical protein